jgi:hypothetical protein
MDTTSPIPKWFKIGACFIGASGLRIYKIIDIDVQTDRVIVEEREKIEENTTTRVWMLTSTLYYISNTNYFSHV